jgi:hypothetical protein
MTDIEISLPFKDNFARIYHSWWDIINIGTMCFLLFIGFFVIGLSYSLDIGISKYVDYIPIERRFEIGLSTLSISVTAGAASALWIISRGMERWAISRRIYFSARRLLKILNSYAENKNIKFGPQNAANLNEILLRHFDNINYVNKYAQNAYEEYINASSTCDFEEAVYLISNIGLWTKGHVKISSAHSKIVDVIIAANQKRGQRLIIG